MQMNQLQIKDNQIYLNEEMSKVEELRKKVSDKTLEQLEKEGVFVFPNTINDSEDIKEEQMILQTVNSHTRTGNVMGFIGYKNERLTIGSRFSRGEKDFFFQYLLENVLEFPNVVEMNTDGNQENRLFNMLIFLFPSYLKSALRKGVYKTYNREEYNDYNIKGAIDIARHIRQNIPFTGKIAYNQREFSFDNNMMELIRHTIEFINMKSFGKQLLSKVVEEVKTVIEVTSSYGSFSRKKVIEVNKKNPIHHAYYHEYRTLQRLCIMILQNQKHQIGIGSNQIHGILFDGSWLWEEYINSLISDKFYHPMNKSRKGAQQLFSTDTGKAGLIYPDFLSRDIKNRFVADAKYKPVENIGNKDYLQVLAYMFRFNAKSGFYLYPERHTIQAKTLTLNEGSTYEKNVKSRKDIFVTKLGLLIPYGYSTYETFASEMKKREIEFVSCLYSDLEDKNGRFKKEEN